MSATPDPHDAALASMRSAFERMIGEKASDLIRRIAAPVPMRVSAPDRALADAVTTEPQ